MPPALVTRFAPSPTGHLHAGHAYSAGLAYLRAKQVPGQSGGRFLLRIEDIDATRCRPDLTDDLLADLAWLGLTWEQPVRRQSQHFNEYRAALDDLSRRGLLYPCFCTRKQVQEEITRMGAAPHGLEGALYPGTCRHLSADERARRMDAGENHALRLDMAAALNSLGEAAQHLHWHDEHAGPQHATPDLLLNGIGDVVLARKDSPASYHLCVTHDDALQGITLIIRGEDLFAATHLHRLLQALFGLRVPGYAHHALLLDADGNRMAKRRGSKSLRDLRLEGADPAALWRQLGLEGIL